MAHETSRSGRSSALFSNLQRLTALVGGAVLTLVGVSGFLASGDQLLVFGVNPLHNGFHLLTGVFGLGVGLVGTAYADEYNQSMAVLYGALLLGWFVSPDRMVELLNSGAADAGLHAALAIVFGLVGFFGAIAGYGRT